MRGTPPRSADLERQLPRKVREVGRRMAMPVRGWIGIAFFVPGRAVPGALCLGALCLGAPPVAARPGNRWATKQVGYKTGGLQNRWATKQVGYKIGDAARLGVSGPRLELRVKRMRFGNRDCYQVDVSFAVSFCGFLTSGWTTLEVRKTVPPQATGGRLALGRSGPRVRRVRDARQQTQRLGGEAVCRTLFV